MGDWLLEEYGRYYGPGGDGDDNNVYTRCPACGHAARNGYCFYCGAGKRQPKTAADEARAVSNQAAALRLWDETFPATGTVVETYLRGRAITIPLPPDLRWHSGLWHSAARWRYPAMVAARTDVTGGLVAIHRTFLAMTGQGKAPVDPPRMDLGPAKGSAVRLAPIADELLIGEGIETTLSAMQVAGRPGWAAGSAVMLRDLVLPAAVRAVIILADGDEAGISASRAAAARWLREGRQVRIAYAPAGKDFNDLLVAEAHHA